MVGAGSSQPGAVPAERDPADGSVAHEQGPGDLQSGCPPEPDRSVITSGSEDLAIRAEGDGVDSIAVLHDGAYLATRTRVPEHGSAVLLPPGEETARPVEGYG